MQEIMPRIVVPELDEDMVFKLFVYFGIKYRYGVEEECWLLQLMGVFLCFLSLLLFLLFFLSFEASSLYVLS